MVPYNDNLSKALGNPLAQNPPLVLLEEVFGSYLRSATRIMEVGLISYFFSSLGSLS